MQYIEFIRANHLDMFQKLVDTKPLIDSCIRIIAKMTSHLLRHLLLIDFGVNVHTFETVSAF